MKITTTPAGYPHITRDQNGVLRIDDTGYKVLVLLGSYRGQHPSVEEFYNGFPHMSRAQLHALLAYYYDHQAEIDAEIEQRWAEADRLRDELHDPTLGERLRERMPLREASSATT